MIATFHLPGKVNYLWGTYPGDRSQSTVASNILDVGRVMAKASNCPTVGWDGLISGSWGLVGRVPRMQPHSQWMDLCSVW